jgi:WD40 repeat protein
MDAGVNSDATRLYIRRVGQPPQLISVSTGRRVDGDIERAPENTSFMSFSDDGRRFVTVRGRTAKVWDARTGALVATSPEATERLQDVALSPDGRTVVLQPLDGSLRIWDVQTERSTPLRGPVGEVFGELTFDPRGRYLISTATASGAEIWDVEAARSSTLTLPGRGAGDFRGFFSTALSPRGDVIAIAGAHGKTRLRHTTTGRQIKVLPGGPRDRGPDTAHAFSPDGSRLVAAGTDGTARLWAVRSGRLMAKMRTGPKPVNDVAFSPGGRLIATAGGDGRTRLWHTGSSRPSATLTGGRGRVLSVAFSSDGAKVVTATRDKTARVWDAKSGRLLTTLSPERRFKRKRWTYVPYPGAQFNPRGDRVMMLGLDGAMRLWDSDGRLLVEVRGRRRNLINHAAFSPDGRRIAAGADDRMVHVYDGRTGAPMTTLCCAGEVVRVHFSPDGRMVVGAGSDGRARVWNVESRAQLAILGRRSFLQSLSAEFLPDGRRILITLDDRTAQISTCATCGSASALKALAAERVGRSLTPGERRRYLHEGAQADG